RSLVKIDWMKSLPSITGTMDPSGCDAAASWLRQTAFGGRSCANHTLKPCVLGTIGTEQVAAGALSVGLPPRSRDGRGRVSDPEGSMKGSAREAGLEP